MLLCVGYVLSYLHIKEPVQHLEKSVYGLLQGKNVGPYPIYPHLQMAVQIFRLYSGQSILQD